MALMKLAKRALKKVKKPEEILENALSLLWLIWK